MTTRADPQTKVLLTVAMILIPLAAVVSGWFFRPVWGWLTVTVLVLVFIVTAGQQIAGLWRGALIDNRNKTSLSRFQTVLWTVLVVSAFLVAALHNIRTKQTDPLKIDVPPELWILLGISLTSLVGSGLIKQEKAKSVPKPDSARLAFKARGVEPGKIAPVGNQLVEAADPAAAADPSAAVRTGTVLAKGVLAVNATPDKSSWLDMFRSEEVGAMGLLDLGKIQMFFFTIIIVFSYAVALGSLFVNTAGEITAFPAISQSAIALLGISHAGYLANKTVSRTPTT
jgi:hypothetical protein